MVGGAEIYVERIARHLSGDHEVSVITTRPFKGARSLRPMVSWRDRIRVYEFYPVNVYYTYYAKRMNPLRKPFWHTIDLWNPHSYSAVKSILHKERPDVVHTHNLGGLSLSTFDAVKGLDLPLVHTIHDYALLCPKANLYRSSENVCESPYVFCGIYRSLKRKLAGGKPDVVTAPSKFALEIHKDHSFFAESEHLHLPLGVETKNVSRRRPRGTPSLLYAGQLARHKGVSTLIAALKGLPNIDLRLDIAGDGPERGKLKELSRGDGRIKFHGFLRDDEMAQLYDKAGALVVPSLWYENSPFVIYEGLSRGVPVVGSEIGGIPELIRDGYNGFLFAPGDALDLKRKIEELVGGDLARLSRNALESSKGFEMEKHIEKLLRLYEEISH
jgi:glycosyltransferase involved in cell wall biosynthesis